MAWLCLALNLIVAQPCSGCACRMGGLPVCGLSLPVPLGIGHPMEVALELSS